MILNKPVAKKLNYAQIIKSFTEKSVNHGKRGEDRYSDCENIAAYIRWAEKQNKMEGMSGAKPIDPE